VELTDTNWSTGLFFLAIQLFTWEPKKLTSADSRNAVAGT
jgi:hypothetical protein